MHLYLTEQITNECSLMYIYIFSFFCLFLHFFFSSLKRKSVSNRHSSSLTQVHKANYTNVIVLVKDCTPSILNIREVLILLEAKFKTVLGELNTTIHHRKQGNRTAVAKFSSESHEA